MKEKFALLCAAFSLFAGCAGPIAESGAGIPLDGGGGRADP